MLYRAALSSLSVARATSLDQSLIDYLESLCARAYFFVYGARAPAAGAARPASSRTTGRRRSQALWRETLVAAALIAVVGAVVGYRAGAARPGLVLRFIPPELAGGRDPTAIDRLPAQHALRRRRRRRGPVGASPPSCSPTMPRSRSSPSRSGFAFGVPTAFLLSKRRDARRLPRAVRLARPGFEVAAG